MRLELKTRDIIFFCLCFFASTAAEAQTGGLRDSLLYRSGFMQTTSVDVTKKNVANATKVDSSFLYGGIEYNRTFMPRADFRIGARLTTNFTLNRMQVQETFVGSRYYPFTLGTDFSGPVGGYSIAWTSFAKPYVEAQLAMGHYIAEVIGDPAVYDLSSSYVGFGAGAGCKFFFLQNFAADVGVNYQYGLSFGSVILDPVILHAYLGVATSF
ncbi:MAG: hypothetical protein RIR26_2306 [Pseudomonadota bacterium]|jgi:opacity protein-like surface antigen